MAEQKKTNEALNVEDALTQSEAFLIKNKKAIIGAVLAIVIIVAGVVMYKNLYAQPREEKAQAALFKDRNISKPTSTNKPSTATASVTKAS